MRTTTIKQLSTEKMLWVSERRCKSRRSKKSATLRETTNLPPKESPTLRPNRRTAQSVTWMKLRTNLSFQLLTFDSPKFSSLANCKLTNWTVWSGWPPCTKTKWTASLLTTWASEKQFKRSPCSVTFGRPRSKEASPILWSPRKARFPTGWWNLSDGLHTSKL